MSRAASRWTFAAGLILVAALPLLGRALRGAAGPRCPVDGVRLAATPMVEVAPEGADPSSPLGFCCVGCADRWLRGAGFPPVAVRVRDEASGRLVDAGEAHFVRSRVVAQPATDDRIHAFATLEEARRHARAYRGRLLSGDERPLRGTP